MTQMYFHIVTSAAAADPSNLKYVKDAMWRNQLAILSRSYANSSIYFSFQGVTRTINDTWAANGDDIAMKTALRQGTYSTLNVYFQSDLQTAPDPSLPVTPGYSDVLLGYCSLPSAGVTTDTPSSSYASDGCNILSGTMPGGTVTDYNMGGTAIHEIGHWNGLLHPFMDQTCDPSDLGDYIADTPQESIPTDGCPVGKDSCPSSGYDPNDPSAVHTAAGYEGLDPIHNFMDYSNDGCYEGFTGGQAARMWNIWAEYRQGR
ncbi:MAG: hypothetical protein Q9227_008608 [Pyrenula ochraceoflavens]